jgi:hypothetical protein
MNPAPNGGDCQSDHDRLIVLEARFVEYRNEMEARLEKLNELRQQVETDRRIYLRTDVYDAQFSELRKQLIELKNWQTWALGVGTTLITLAMISGIIIGHIWK